MPKVVTITKENRHELINEVVYDSYVFNGGV